MKHYYACQLRLCAPSRNYIYIYEFIFGFRISSTWMNEHATKQLVLQYMGRFEKFMQVSLQQLSFRLLL